MAVEHVPDKKATSLNIALDGMFGNLGLSMSNLRGQGYDGASNMRGEFRGLQRLILAENPYAHYIHCFAHQLQLVVVAVAKCCSSVRDFFEYTSMVVNIVNASCKRHDQLAQEQHDETVGQIEARELLEGRGKTN